SELSKSMSAPFASKEGADRLTALQAKLGLDNGQMVSSVNKFLGEVHGQVGVRDALRGPGGTQGFVDDALGLRGGSHGVLGYIERNPKLDAAMLQAGMARGDHREIFGPTSAMPPQYMTLQAQRMQ